LEEPLTSNKTKRLETKKEIPVKMGVDPNTLRFLLSASKRGINFGRLATIGRHQMHCRQRHVWAAAREFGLACDVEQVLTRSCGGYAEPLWAAMGAQEIVSIDASDYEGASIVHDMNDPIPDGLRCRFDAVFDLGSLEHIFNFPVAIKNCMEMPVIGGRIFAVLPASNYCGHGFYQFSPDLFYRTLNSDNGYHIERMLLAESGADARWYTVPDAAAVRQRTMYSAPGRFVLMIEAVRQRDVPLLQKWPQQSDYELQWSGTGVRRSYRDESGLGRALGSAGMALERSFPPIHTITSAMRNAYLRMALVRAALSGRIISETIRPVKHHAAEITVNEVMPGNTEGHDR
jgi:hypothetical protein